MSQVKIYSRNVVLVEGNADELVPHTESAVGMHGYAIMVPPGEGSEWLLDMVWRITIAYAGLRSLLMRRSTVRKMVEAVMSANAAERKSARRKAIQSRSPERPESSPRTRTKVRIKQAVTPGPLRQARSKGSARKKI